MKITLPRLVIGVLALWLLTAILVLFAQLSGSSTASLGQFGDVFGSINALFSGLAFVGLIWAIRLQQHQLAIQRKELKMQREELKLQREEMKASRDELANQVAAHRALFLASIGQIELAALQAEVETFKLQRDHVSQATSNIRDVMVKMRRLARSIESDAARLSSNSTWMYPHPESKSAS